MKRLLITIMRQPRPEPSAVTTPVEEKDAIRAQHADLERRIQLLRALGQHFGQ